MTPAVAPKPSQWRRFQGSAPRRARATSARAAPASQPNHELRKNIRAGAGRSGKSRTVTPKLAAVTSRPTPSAAGSGACLRSASHTGKSA
jgi:hypothetical protein